MPVTKYSLSASVGLIHEMKFSKAAFLVILTFSQGYYWEEIASKISAVKGLRRLQIADCFFHYHTVGRVCMGMVMK